MIFTEAEKKRMLALAGRAIEAEIYKERMPSTQAESITETLRAPCGAFVSIYVEDKLRGCVGTFSEESPLFRNIERMAVSAVSSDSRFSAVQVEELHKLRIEISVLTPRIPVTDSSEIEIGKHGIYMIRGSSRGTLLPQVAVQQQWTVEEFLGYCARDKAGIEWDGWKDAELYSYEAIVFRADLKEV